MLGSSYETWIRRDFGDPATFSLRFVARGGVVRLYPPPVGAPVELSLGASQGQVHDLGASDLFVLQVLTAGSPAGPWRSRPLMAQGPGILSELVPGVWAALATEANQLAVPPRRSEPATLMTPFDDIEALDGFDDDPDMEPPIEDAERPTEQGMVAMPGVEDEPMEPIGADSPTDLSLLPPPMARLQALRLRRQLGASAD